MNNKGFTLTEVAVCVGLMAFAATLLMVPQLEIQKSFTQNETKIARVLESQSLQQKLTSSHLALKKSALASPVNDELCPCVIGGQMKSGTNPICVKSTCTAEVGHEYIFYDPQVEELVPIAGTMASPVYFTSDGGPCAANEESESVCAYKAVVQFTAHCPGGLPTCDHADYLSIELSLLPLGNRIMAESKRAYIYPIIINYPPVLPAMADETIQISLSKQIAIAADAGHPSEKKNFVFEQCSSSDKAVVELKCYRFINSEGQIILNAKSVGEATITLQVNDGGLENNLSNVVTFKVTVIP